jgi:sugar phosphate isomerase/epimerase
MRIAISNLAWDVTDDKQIAALLNTYGIDAIDVAPGKYFPDIRAANVSEMVLVRDWWATRGIAITGMQALLFGTTGLNLFGDREIQTSMLAHLDSICRIGAGLGATRLVFGSPKNRDRSSLSDEQTHSIAVTFFRRLGDIAAQHGVIFCLEPNPPCYGANFMTSSAETAQTVMDVAHPAIRMQLDTGAITINGEDPCQVITEFGDLIGHVHASEPDLVVLGDGTTDHGRVASALRGCLPDQVVSIEMLPAKNESSLIAVERALGVAIRNYRNNGVGAST